MEGIQIGNWKRAFTLSTFELRTSTKQISLLTLLYIAIFIVMIDSLANYFENGSFIFDLFFITIFAGVTSSWGKGRSSQASSRFIMFQQLPTKQATVIKSWFITYFIYTLPFLCILLISLYIASTDLQTMMSPLTYVCFSIVLLSFAAMSVENIPTDRVEKFDNQVTRKRILTLASAAIIFISIYVFTQFFSTYGIVHWFIIIIQKQPLLIASLSIVLTIMCLRYRYLKMKKQIATADYL